MDNSRKIMSDEQYLNESNGKVCINLDCKSINVKEVEVSQFRYCSEYTCLKCFMCWAIEGNHIEDYAFGDEPPIVPYTKEEIKIMEEDFLAGINISNHKKR